MARSGALPTRKAGYGFESLVVVQITRISVSGKSDMAMSPEEVGGIHHVTAIASDPQRNLDFYAGLLGLRLVKRTVNFDDPGTYHFYFGDETGTPGSLLTFFPWPGAHRGRPGPGGRWPFPPSPSFPLRSASGSSAWCAMPCGTRGRKFGTSGAMSPSA